MTTAPFRLPDIDLRQMLSLTDDTGMVQHATYGIPDHHHGYCIDDNARALIAGLLHAQLRGYDETHVPLHRYLAFIAYAFNAEKGRFRNFMAFDRRWLEEIGSEDSHGRTLWALGTAVELAPRETMRSLARRLFLAGLPTVRSFPFMRPWAFALLGLDAFLRTEPDNEEALKTRKRLGRELFDSWRDLAAGDWPWWENEVTYDNARLPQALLLTGHALGDEAMCQTGLEVLSWLIEVQTGANGQPSIIGNDGWFTRKGTRARFDQQPLEVCALVNACLDAARISGDETWRDRAHWAWTWFTGHNDVGTSLLDPETGGCFDGLHENGVNRNQGAESCLALLMAVLHLHIYHLQRDRRSTFTIDGPPGVGLIGASGFADFCTQRYRHQGTVRPIAVWSRTPERRRAFGERHGIDAYDELAGMLADPRIQVVHIATTPATHAELALAALAAGKHVLVEKPLAIDLTDAHRVALSAAERDRRVMTDHLMRYGPLVECVQTLTHSGILGTLLRGTVINCGGDDGLPPDHWFWDRHQSGGIFIEHGVHFFDLLRYWLGEGRIQSAHQLSRPGTGLVDQVACEAWYPPQTSVGYYHGFHQSHHLDRTRIALVFERGELCLHGWVSDHLELDAVLSHAALDRLRTTLPPGASIDVVRELQGDERRGSRRTGIEQVDAVVHAEWRAAGDKQAVYGRAFDDLMTDFLISIDLPNHRPRVTMHDAITVLDLAATADRLAHEEMR